LEEQSYLKTHPEEFGIKPDFRHSLYWESADETNTYPVRRERYDKFNKYADSLGINVAVDLGTSAELDKLYTLGNYYSDRKDYINAIRIFNNYLDSDPENSNVKNKVKQIENLM
jgi:hypothetical protein